MISDQESEKGKDYAEATEWVWGETKVRVEGFWRTVSAIFTYEAISFFSMREGWCAGPQGF